MHPSALGTVSKGRGRCSRSTAPCRGKAGGTSGGSTARGLGCSLLEHFTCVRSGERAGIRGEKHLQPWDTPSPRARHCYRTGQVPRPPVEAVDARKEAEAEGLGRSPQAGPGTCAAMNPAEPLKNHAVHGPSLAESARQPRPWLSVVSSAEGLILILQSRKS